MRKILFVFAIGLLLLAFPLFSDGMFMDGLIYAAVADNFSNGVGTWFNLSFSETVMSSFYEHPPLAIWLESAFHYGFNGSLMSERLYSLSTWFVNGILILLLWKELKQPMRLAWFPILIWFVMPDVLWAFSNNVLENTMGVFVTLSVIFYLKSLEKRRVLFVFLYSLTIVLILLTKGFTGVYVLAFPILVGLFWKRTFLLRTIIDTAFSLVVLGLILVALWFSSEDAAYYFKFYLTNQVKGSVENVQVVSWRGQIIIEFINGLAIPLVLVLMCFLYAKKKRIRLNPAAGANRLILVLILLSLCGVLPIMVSLKQRVFYILTVYPFVIIALSIYIKPILYYLDDWMLKHVFNKVVVYGSVLTALSFAIVSSTFVGRDEQTVNDVYAIKRIVPSGETIDVSSSNASNWALLGYLSRYDNISINKSEIKSNYFLRLKSDPDIISYREYELQSFVLEVINPTDNP